MNKDLEDLDIPGESETPGRDAENARSYSAWHVATRTGWMAAKQNRIPAFVLWLFGIGIVAGYFYVPAIHDGLESAGRFKESYGWRFSLVSTALFGGLIPSLIARRLNRQRQSSSRDYLVSNTLFWGYKGVEIDLFYHGQALLFGATPDFATIAVKTFCDQFLMVPVFGIVNVVLFYVWRDCGWSIGKVPAALGRQWYRRKVLPVLIANWIVWIPAVAMIYSLPLPLQLPVQNLILCFWILILMVFTQEPNDRKTSDVEPEFPATCNQHTLATGRTE